MIVVLFLWLIGWVLMPCWWRSERLNLGLCYSGIVEALSRCLWLVDVGTFCLVSPSWLIYSMPLSILGCLESKLNLVSRGWKPPESGIDICFSGLSDRLDLLQQRDLLACWSTIYYIRQLCAILIFDHVNMFNSDCICWIFILPNMLVKLLKMWI